MDSLHIIGRVILNAVDEKKKKLGSTGERNCRGIQQNISLKIFQPFFTINPTCRGTGLGLTMSYDVVTKAHSGSLMVESKEGEGSTFILVLPAE